ncbi:PAS domain-containing sensor histidine kinase [Cytophagaceae bacterium ABcell3]|nr:PAS domain-containing sensor histidine kinase [Cytophagaceae bacterium ABcell3]
MKDLFEKIVEKSLDGVLVLEPVAESGSVAISDFYIKFYNSKISEFLGVDFTENELLSNVASTFNGRLINSFPELIDQGMIYIGNVSLSGQNKVFDAHVQIIDDLIIATFTKVVEKVACGISETQGILEEVQELAKLGIFEWDIVEGKMTWTKQLYDIYGIDPNKFTLTPESALEVVHPEDQEYISKLFKSAKSDFEYKFRFIHKKRPEGFAFGRTKFVKDQNGNVVKVMGFTQDITERVRLENLLLESQKIAQVGSFEWDVVSDKLTGTPQFFKILGQQGSSMNMEDFLRLVHPEDLKIVKHNISLIFQGEQVDDLVYRAILPSGREVYLMAQCKTYKNSKNEAAKVIGTIYNVTDLYLTKLKLKEINTELEEKITERTKDLTAVNNELRKINEELDKFAYTVSHDLKSPLNSIIPLLRFIRKESEDKLSKDSLLMMDMVGERLGHMGSMISQILESARNTNKVKEPVNLNMLIQDVLVGLQVPEHITVKIQPNLPKVKYHKISLFQVFQNLLSNAIKFNNKEHGIIKVYCEKHGSNYQIFVEDNGIGIKPEDKDRIFGMFQVGHENEALDSTGLGLAIVKDIVEEHGGAIQVDSAPNKGAVFKFTVPI